MRHRPRCSAAPISEPHYPYPSLKSSLMSLTHKRQRISLANRLVTQSQVQ